LSEEDCEIDEVRSVLKMAEDVLPKLDIVLKKLEAMETKLNNPGSNVKSVDAQVIVRGASCLTFLCRALR